MKKDDKYFRIVFGDYVTEWLLIDEWDTIDVTQFLEYPNVKFEFAKEAKKENVRRVIKVK